jgi:uncharacterized protein YjeT (DUF2065 family)
MMSRRGLASGALRVAGMVLMALGVVHLIMRRFSWPVSA